MEDRLSKLLKSTYYHPESRLSDDIWVAIVKKEERIQKVKSLTYSSLSFLSLFGFVVMIFSTKNQFASSGFFEYVSLAFSNSDIIISYWRELLLSVVESLPVTGLLVSSLLLFTTFLFIKKAINQLKFKGQKLLTV